MARPEQNWITFEIDGREVRAPEGAMLVDAAKHGDVEIPFFCYEPKLGQPVGACRMCLVEIEGIPKLQTSCSTPVRDGMVVNTTSDRVKHAQNAIVEFLLVNHPLDCPVCDKGGECPLQDISYGWGAGRSRFIEPKRHFKKPLELSPLIAIDRERCILCYRCVRFSQEVAEDYQLVFLDRGDHTFVGTHDGHPYVAPFSGNIIELCPVGALTSRAYRFRARPWDIEDAGSVCTLCPSQCNVKLTIRDDIKVVRVLARDNDEVDDGWLCDKGRFGYQSFSAEERITAPLVRDGGYLREVSWERALSDAAAALKRSGADTVAVVGGSATNEEGFLVQHLLREGLGSPHLNAGPTPAPRLARALARPDLSARVSDVDHAGVILVLDTELVDEAPILDLRVRKAVRRNNARLLVASSRPSTLDPNATVALRFAPGGAEAVLGALAAALGSSRVSSGSLEERATRAGATTGFIPGRPQANGAGPPNATGAVRAAADVLRDAGDVVIVWGERVFAGERGEQGLEALLALAETLGIADRDESGLIAVPDRTNGRGLREVGCSPALGPGLADAAEAGDPDRRARRPACRRRRAAGARAHASGVGDRVRRLPYRGARGTGGHRLPGRDLRGEGGHRHPPGRAPPARAPSPRPRRRGARRLGRARRALRADGCGPRRAEQPAGQCPDRRARADLRRHDAGRDRRPRQALAGRRGRGCARARAVLERAARHSAGRAHRAAARARFDALERPRDRVLALAQVPGDGPARRARAARRRPARCRERRRDRVERWRVSKPSRRLPYAVRCRRAACS